MKDPSSVVMLTADRQIDRRILLEADTLEAAGWQVTIVAMPAERAGADDRRVVRLPASAGGVRETAILAAYRQARSLLPMNGPVMRRLKEATWRFLADQENFYTKLFLPTALTYRPTVFLAHDLPMLPVAAAAARASDAKLAYDSHELYAEQEFSTHERQGWITIERKHIASADLVVTVNPSIAHELEKRYGLAHVGVVMNAELPRPASPTQRSLIHDRLGLPSGARILLFQGGLTSNRNLETMVEAMPLVTGKDIHLVLLGDGQLASGLLRRASALGVAARVHHRAAVAQSELLDWSAAADIGLVPYQPTCLNNRLCTPNKLFEFIAAGTPILASDLPELRRIVAGHDIGIVADLATSAAAASAIDAAFADAQRLAGWRQAVVTAQQELNWRVEGSKFAALFEALR